MNDNEEFVHGKILTRLMFMFKINSVYFSITRYKTLLAVKMGDSL